MTEPDDELTAALRRDLAGTAVPHDDDRADAMIRVATATDPRGARSWQAPLAAAAAVVVIGGSAEAIATHGGGGGSPSGGGPVACPAASSSATPVPSTTAAAPSAADDDPCATSPDTPNPSAVYPLPPVSSSPASTSPASTSAALPTAGVGTPGEAASSTTFVITADPGTTTSRTYSAPGGQHQPFAIELHRASGRGGSLRVSNGSAQLVLDTDTTASTTGHVVHLLTNPKLFELSCTGTTICSIQVTLDPATPVGEPSHTTTPSR